MTPEEGEKRSIKVGVFGSKEGGKTQLVHALLGKEFSHDYVSTVGILFNSLPSIKGGTLDIAEMGDALRFDGLIEGYSKQFADVSVICIDQSNEHSLDRARTYVEKVKKGNPDTQIIIAVTRIDISPPKITSEKIIQFKADNNLNDAPIIETSSKDKRGIKALCENIFLLSILKEQEKIKAFSKKVADTIEAINTLKTNTYDPDNSPAFKALKILKSEIDTAKSKETAQGAIDKFSQAVNDNTLTVEPPNVRWQITRFFQALINWDKSYFADNQKEINEKANFLQQTSLKEHLTSFKNEAEEGQSKLRPK